MPDGISFEVLALVKKNPRIAAYIAIVVSSIVILISGYILWKFPSRPQILAELREISTEFSSSLGEPRATPAGDVVAAFFDNGIALWIANKNSIFRLKRDGSFDIRAHATETLERKWWDPDHVSRVTKLPRTNVPLGGIAFEWSLNPGDWKWLGKMQRQCTLRSQVSMYQEFENAFISAGFPLAVGSPDGQALILFNDGHWVSRRIANAARPCTESSN